MSSTPFFHKVSKHTFLDLGTLLPLGEPGLFGKRSFVSMFNRAGESSKGGGLLVVFLVVRVRIGRISLS
jgi:hypothetical protein